MEEEKLLTQAANTEELEELLGDASVFPDEESEKFEKDERQDIELDRLKVQLEQQKEELAGKKQDRIQRGDFSYHIFGLLWFYIVVVLSIVIVVASGLAELSDTVLCVLLGTTTANVIGIFNFVAQYLFHTKE